MNVLEVKNLQVLFHTVLGTATAVRNLNFCVKEGEILGIVGESGSGKSVTSLAIMGLLDEKAADISQGEIWFDGKNLLELNEKEFCKIRGKDMTMVFQEPAMALNPVKKVKKQLQEVYRIHTPNKVNKSTEELVELLKKLNISDAELVLNKYPFELSGGIKQRIMIAMAMISKPKLLIADEPTTALDVTTQSEILDLLKSIQKETNCAIILITHDLGVIAEMADRVMVMYRGELVEESESSEFFKRPRHPYSQDLMKARPEFFSGKFYSIAGSIPNAYQPMKGCGYCGRCIYEEEICRTKDVPLFRLDDKTQVRCCRITKERAEDEARNTIDKDRTFM